MEEETPKETKAGAPEAPEAEDAKEDLPKEDPVEEAPVERHGAEWAKWNDSTSLVDRFYQ